MKYLIPTLLMLNLGTATHVYSVETTPRVALPPVSPSMNQDGYSKDIASNPEAMMPSEANMDGLVAPLPEALHEAHEATVMPEHMVDLDHEPSISLTPEDTVGMPMMPEVAKDNGMVAPLDAKQYLRQRLEAQNPEAIVDEKHPQALAAEQTFKMIEQLIDEQNLTEPAVKQAGEMLKELHEGGVPPQYQQEFSELTTRVQVAAGKLKAGSAH